MGGIAASRWGPHCNLTQDEITVIGEAGAKVLQHAPIAMPAGRMALVADGVMLALLVGGIGFSRYRVHQELKQQHYAARNGVMPMPSPSPQNVTPSGGLFAGIPIE